MTSPTTLVQSNLTACYNALVANKQFSESVVQLYQKYNPLIDVLKDKNISVEDKLKFIKGLKLDLNKELKKLATEVSAANMAKETAVKKRQACQARMDFVAYYTLDFRSLFQELLKKYREACVEVVRKDTDGKSHHLLEDGGLSMEVFADIEGSNVPVIFSELSLENLAEIQKAFEAMRKVINVAANLYPEKYRSINSLFNGCLPVFAYGSISNEYREELLNQDSELRRILSSNNKKDALQQKLVKLKGELTEANSGVNDTTKYLEFITELSLVLAAADQELKQTSSKEDTQAAIGNKDKDKNNPAGDLPQNFSALQQEIAASAHIHEAVMVALEKEMAEFKLKIGGVGSAFSHYQGLYDLQKKTFKVDGDLSLSIEAYLQLLKAKEAIIREHNVSAKADKKYHELMDEYHQHLNTYILFIEKYIASLGKNLGQLKHILLENAVINPFLQDIINNNPNILSDNPAQLLLQLNKLNDAIFSGDKSYQEIFVKAGFPLNQSQLIQIEGYCNIIKEKIADKSNFKPSHFDEQETSKSAYDLMPGDEKYIKSIANNNERIVLHEKLNSLRKDYNNLHEIKSLNDWNKHRHKIIAFYAVLVELDLQMQEKPEKYTPYDRARWEDISGLYVKYQKANFKYVAPYALELAKTIVENQKKYILISVEMAELQAEIEGLKREADLFLQAKSAFSEDRYQICNKIYNAISKLGELKNKLDGIHAFIEVDDVVLTLLGYSDADKKTMTQAYNLIKDNNLKAKTENLLDAEQQLAELSGIESKITHDNTSARLLYGLLPHEKIHYQADLGLVKKAKENSLFILAKPGTSAETLAAFNNYLDMIEASIYRYQPDRDLFARLITCSWGRTILKNASSSESGRRILARVNNINEALIAIYSDNILAIETKLFLAVKPKHFLIARNKVDPAIHASRIAFADYGIQLTNETIKLILRQSTAEELVFTIEQQIWLAHECQKKGAYNSMISIVNGLTAVTKIISRVKTCLTPEAQQILEQLYKVQNPNNASLQTEIIQREDAIPSLAHFLYTESMAGEYLDVSGKNKATNNGRFNLETILVKKQAVLSDYSQIPITMAEYKAKFVDLKPAADFDEWAFSETKKVLENGVVALTPLFSEIKVKPSNEIHGYLETENIPGDFNIDAHLEMHRIIELDRVMSKLYAEIAKLNVEINKEFQKLVQFVAQPHLKNSTPLLNLLAIIDSAYKKEMTPSAPKSLDYFQDDYNTQGFYLREIYRILVKYQNVIAGIKENPAYREILVYPAAKFAANSELHHQYIEKWHRIFGIASTQASISPEAIEKFERERREKADRFAAAFKQVDKVLPFIRAVRDCMRVQADLDMLYNDLLRTYQGDKNALKILGAIRSSASTGKVINPEALKMLKNAQDANQLLELCGRLQASLTQAGREEGILLEHTSTLSEETVETIKSKQADLENVIKKEKVFVEEPLANDSFLSETKETQMLFKNDQEVPEQQIFLKHFKEEAALLSEQLINFDYKNKAILNYAEKNNLVLIRSIAEMHLGNKSNEEIYAEFCRGVPEPTSAEKNILREILELHNALIQKIHLIRVFVEKEVDSNPHKRDGLTKLGTLEKMLFQVNVDEIQEILVFGNLIGMKYLLERSDSAVLFIHGNYVGDSEEKRKAIEAEYTRCWVLKTVSNISLRELFLSKPNVVLNNDKIEQINSAIANPAVTQAQFNKLLKDLSVGVSVNESFFNRARREAIIGHLLMVNQEVDVGQLISQLTTANAMLAPVRAKLDEFNFKSKLNALTKFSANLHAFTRNKLNILSDISNFSVNVDPTIFNNYAELYKIYRDLKAVYAGEHDNFLRNIPDGDIAKAVSFCDESFLQFEKTVVIFRQLLTEWVNYLHEEFQLQQANYHKIDDKLTRGEILNADDRADIKKYRQALDKFAVFIFNVEDAQKIESVCKMMGINLPVGQAMARYESIVLSWQQTYTTCLSADVHIVPLSYISPSKQNKGLTIRLPGNLPTAKINNAAIQTPYQTEALELDNTTGLLITSIRKLTSGLSADKKNYESSRSVYSCVANESNSTKKTYQVDANKVKFEQNCAEAKITFDPMAENQLSDLTELDYQQQKHVVRCMVDHVETNATSKAADIYLEGEEYLCQKAAILLYSKGFHNIFYPDKNKFSPLDWKHADKIPQLFHKMLKEAAIRESKPSSQEEFKEEIGVYNP